MEQENEDEKMEYLRNLEKLLEHIETVDSHFYQMNNMVLTFPLLVNAGAVIALANVFINTTIPGQIIYAALAFLSGTVFGLLTIVYELYVSYARWISPRKLNLPLKGEDLNKINGRLKQYLVLNWRDKTYKPMMFRVVNGGLSIIFCLIGIFFTTAYVLKSYCLITLAAFLLILYCIGSFIWLRKKLNSE